MGKANQEPDGFARFWEVWRPYQRATDGRGKARPAFQKMIERGEDPQDIIDGAAWYLRSLPEKDRPYTPLAASWINSERWADDCVHERARQAQIAATKRQTIAESPNVEELRPARLRPSEEERAAFVAELRQKHRV